MKKFIRQYPFTTVIGALSIGLLLTSLIGAEQSEEKKPAGKERLSAEKQATPKQEAPGKPENAPGKPVPPDGPERTAKRQPPKAPAHPATSEPVTFLGVAAIEVPPAVRAHLDLPRGIGISVGEVMPESPAARAGVKVHDILTKLDDQLLLTLEQFQILVRMKEPGDKVALTCLSAGKERTLDITLDSRRFPLAEAPPHSQPPFRFNPSDPREPDRDFDGSEQWRDLQREWTEKMRNWWAKNGDEISEQFQKAMDEAFKNAEKFGSEADDLFDDFREREKPHERHPNQQRERPESRQKDKDPI